MNFSENRLNIQWGVGASGGSEFNTYEVVSASGFVYSNANWIDDLYSVDIGNRVILRSEKDYISSFFKNRKGKNQGFRFKNWTDYKGTNELLAAPNGTNKIFQLYKNYSDGTDTYTKRIIKPVSGTLTVTDNGGAAGAYTVDYTTGIITFTTAPISGHVLRASFEFDLPVKFATDKFELTYLQETQQGGQYQMGSLPIREVPL
jgi:uncharacterized protein (TIGR02217 family)